jgi:hypothetical protein
MQVQNNAYMTEAKTAREAMRKEAERGAVQIATRQHQPLEKFIATGAIAGRAVATGEVKKADKLKKGGGKGKVQKLVGTGRELLGRDGKAVAGKARKAAYAASIVEAMENGTVGKYGEQQGHN